MLYYENKTISHYNTCFYRSMHSYVSWFDGIIDSSQFEYEDSGRHRFHT